ncbi:hypothetical protein HK405_005052 [Cladochytrium tenue]|nr:hypothetical protein HK405_005052 [Cladochytrium tenue]
MDDAGGAAGPNVAAPAAQAAAAGWWAWAGYGPGPGPGGGPGGGGVGSGSVGMDYGGPSLAEKWDLTMFAIISAVGLVIGYLEASGIFNAPYSKFRRERLANWGYVSTRWGMLAIDGVALLIVLLFYLLYAGKVHPQRPYRVPRGGMFFQAACPHYLMELLVWLGFSVVVHRATMYGILVYTSCQLVGRAVQTRRWYAANVRGFPADRTCLVPFLL